MLMHCEVVKKIWRDIERWVSQIGVIEYVVAEDTIVLGELKKVTLAQCYYLDY